ncbi:glucosaminidase domain-containing protein [Enterococcus sp. AZ072]|uniref:C40 family peptidase n=1 Tax=unclassified Enterococcus TaxID=2608891 RepID=UPI003D28E000
MQYKKLASLLTLGVLIAPTVLSTQQAMAMETQDSTVQSSEQTTESTVESTTPEPTPEPQPEPQPQPVPDPEPEPTPEPEPEPEVKTFGLFAEGHALTGHDYTDSAGNVVQFDYFADIQKDGVVQYAVTLKDPNKTVLKEVKIINRTTGTPIKSSADAADSFVMPESDVEIQLVIGAKEQPKPEKPAENTNNDKKPSEPVKEEKPANNTGNNTATPAPAPAEEARQPEAGASDIRVPSDQPVPTIGNDIQNAIVQEAYRHLGKPYVWGAKGPNAFDCSGLAYAVYAAATGHYIGGWTGDQQYSGTQIPVSDAQPGDLLFWGAPTSVTTHVAIYIGNGQYIHAPQPGDVVKIGSLSGFMPTFAVRVNVAGLPKASSSLANAFGQYSSDQPFVFNKNQTTDQFIEKIGEWSREIGQKNGIYSSVMLAQAILESGSGNSSLAAEPNYNLFGIKGKYQNTSVAFRTLEQDAIGSSFQITAEFRKYPSYKESLEDYAELLKEGISGNKDFYKPVWKSETKTYKDATEYLQGRYATDKRYAEKLNAIIDAYNLTEYDHAKSKEKQRPELTDLKTGFTLSDTLRTKLVTTLGFTNEIPEVMSTKTFVNLFRGDSLIALAASTVRSKEKIEQTTSQSSPLYVALSKSLVAVLPPIQ